MGLKDVPSGFFDLEEARPVSAVLSTNAGTAPKFNRMALAGLYQAPHVSMIRYGCMFDPDPNAHARPPFAYVVAGPGSPEKTWGQEAVLFHNPHATYPVPTGLFETVAESFREGGSYPDVLKRPFVSFSSVSAKFDGPGHALAAAYAGMMSYKSLLRIHEALLATGPR